MKAFFFTLLAAVLAVAHAFTVNAAQAPESMAFSEIGAKATADYRRDAIGVNTTPEGASLRTGFQKLSVQDVLANASRRFMRVRVELQ